jgi:malate synthase
VTLELVRQMIPEEIERIKMHLGDNYALGRYEEASQLFDQLVASDQFIEFLTLPAYERVV